MVPPSADQSKDRFLLLSKMLEGDVLQPLWFGTAAEVEAVLGPGSYPVYTVGRFRYHFFLAVKGDKFKSRLAVFWFYVKTGFRVCRERQITCIVAYSHLTTALCAVLLKFLTGVKLVVEVMGEPGTMYIAEQPNPGIWTRIRNIYSTFCLHVTVLSSDRVHLLSRGVLNNYPLLRNKAVSVFHDYTPLSGIEIQKHDDPDNQNIILAGYPWFRKGVDVAISAFRMLAPDFPLARLKIVGHYTDGVPQQLAAGCPQIEIFKAMPQDELMPIVSHSAIMLLPSRNEALGRVLIEGMAAGLPLVGSNVGGIPSLIRDGENGILVPAGDASALEQALRRLLSDVSLRRKMGRRSYELLSGLTEDAYAKEFVSMVDSAMTKDRTPERETGAAA